MFRLVFLGRSGGIHLDGTTDSNLDSCGGLYLGVVCVDREKHSGKQIMRLLCTWSCKGEFDTSQMSWFVMTETIPENILGNSIFKAISTDYTCSCPAISIAYRPSSRNPRSWRGLDCKQQTFFFNHYLYSLEWGWSTWLYEFDPLFSNRGPWGWFPFIFRLEKQCKEIVAGETPRTFSKICDFPSMRKPTIYCDCIIM